MFIFHLGNSGFPSGTNAVMQRIGLTFKGLKLAGCNPLVISKHSLYEAENRKRINRYQGIPYIYTSILTTRPDNFIIRNLNKISGYFGELFLLIKKRKSIQAAIFYGPSFIELVYYRILSKILRFKLIIQYVELISEIQPNHIVHGLNGKAFDNYCFVFCDGIIVISEFLRNRSLSKNKSLPIIKIPAICDFEEFQQITGKKYQANYLMYCGSIGYYSVIEFIIDLYCRLRELGFYQGRLLLAIGIGDKNETSYLELINKIEGCGYGDSIVLEKNVPHVRLIEIYLSAELLIVPLRNVIQDIAGFHHKVGEYSAAEKPIISTNRGEVQYYFRDGISAILADEYTIESYLQKLSEVLPFKEQLKKIAEEGHKVGKEKLNYMNYGFELKQFILSI